MEKYIRDISVNIDGVFLERKVVVYCFDKRDVNVDQLADEIEWGLKLRLTADKYADGFVELKDTGLEVCFYCVNEVAGFEHENVEFRKSDDKVDEVKLQEIVGNHIPKPVKSFEELKEEYKTADSERKQEIIEELLGLR